MLNYADSRTVEEICDNATKLITLMDLCGHHKYLKTTVFCLTGNAPDFAMLVVSANKGLGEFVFFVIARLTLVSSRYHA